MRYSDGDRRAVGRRGRGDGDRVGAAIHSVRAVPRDQLPRRPRPPAAAARPPLRAARARTRTAWRRTASRRPRLLARRGPARPEHHRRARHPPHRRRHRAPRAGPATERLLLPDHRARPRRRHRPQPTLHDAGCRLSSAATATRSSTSSRRCAVSRWTSGWPPQQRGHWTAAELLGAGTGHASLGFADAGDRGRPAGRPGHPRHRAARARPAPAPTSTRRCSPPPPPT